MSQIYINNTSSYLDATLGMGGLTLQLASGEGSKFPSLSVGDYILITLHTRRYENWETVKVIDVSGDTLTIEARAYEGVEQIWASGTKISANITAKTMDLLRDAIEAHDSDIALLQADVIDLQSSSGGDGGGVSITTMSWQASISPCDGLSADDAWFSIVTLDNPTLTRLSSSYSGLPFLGFSDDEKGKALVYRNGVMQKWYEVDSPGIYDYLVDSGYVQWLGHNVLRIFPPLGHEEVITVQGPVVPWHEDENTTYQDLYNDLGVQSSYIMGGTNATTSALEKWLRKYDWATSVITILSTSYDAFNAANYGTGAGGDETSNIYFFGGAKSSGSSDRFEKHNFISVSTTSLTRTATRNGCSLSNGVYACLGGFGTSETNDDEVYKFDYSTDTLSDLGITVDFSNTKYMVGITSPDGAKGVFFNRYNSSGSTSIGQYQVFDYSTESLTSEAALPGSLDSACVAMVFNDGGAYLVDRYLTRVWNFTTGAITSEFDSNAGETLAEGAVGQAAIMCDGLHYGQGERHRFFHSGTKPLWRVVSHRLLQEDGVYIDRRSNGIGCTTDMWSR